MGSALLAAGVGGTLTCCYTCVSLRRCCQVELPEAVLALALSPKEKIIAAATVEDEIACLEVSAGEARWKLSGHDGGVNALAFLGAFHS